MIAKDNASAEDYISRINRALAFVDDHLDDELSLESVALAAHYSPFHFHRIFKKVTNETLNAYITRKRIEKAASVLLRKKEVTIAELSMRYGFNSNSSFTRTFKKFYGVSPSQFREASPGKYSKIRKTDSKNGQERIVFENYICSIDDRKNRIDMNASVKEMSALNLAYVTHVGDCRLIVAAFEKLMQWAGPLGLLNSPDLRMVTVYHDSLKITDPSNLRMSAGIVLKEPVRTGGAIGSMTIESGKFVTGNFEIPLSDFEQAWTGLFVWLNEHGYKTTDRPCFEIHYNNFNEHPEKKCIVELCIPVD